MKYVTYLAFTLRHAVIHQRFEGFKDQVKVKTRSNQKPNDEV